MDTGTLRARLKLALLLRKGVVMPDRQTRHLRRKLTTLLNEQMDLLERETLGVTEDELCEYEDRHDRICDLYAELVDRAAAQPLPSLGGR